MSALRPSQRSNLVEKGVVAGSMMRRFNRQLGMCEEPEDPHPVVHCHQDYPARGKSTAIEQGIEAVAAPTEPGTDSTPDLFAAIQEQLGLRLQATKGASDSH